MNVDDKIILPRHLGILLETIRPLQAQLQAAMAAPVIRSVESGDFAGDMSKSIGVLAGFTHDLSVIVEQELGRVAQCQEASDMEVRRAVARLGCSLRGVLAQYRKVRIFRVHGAELELQNQVVGIFRHTLGEVSRWLNDLVSALEDPERACRQRGLLRAGRVNIELALNLTPAPQARLSDLWEGPQSAPDYQTSPIIRNEPRGGIWCSLGSLVMWWAIIAGVSGGDDC